MDIYSSFGFIDVIVAVVGVYGFYSWYMLVNKHEIKKTLLIGGDTNPAKCKDIEGFASFMGTKLLNLSIAMVVFGGLSAYSSYVQSIGNVIWIGLAIFLAVVIWYCVQLRKASETYFDKGVIKGNTIKNKALKK